MNKKIKLQFGGKSARTAVLAITLILAAFAVYSVMAALNPNPENYLCEVDNQGANDQPGQKDLTQMCEDYTLVDPFYIKWNWDETGWTGTNTGDACSLYDIDADGYANYALCVTVYQDPAVQYIGDPAYSPRLYECNDAYAEKCGNPNLLANNQTLDFNSSCVAAAEAYPAPGTDPFPVGADYPYDTVAECEIYRDEVGGDGAAELIDVCSYPSEQPNSDPSDCIKYSPKFGAIEVKKSTNDPEGKFTLQIDGDDYATDVGDGGSTGSIQVSEGTRTISEIAGTDTDLNDYTTTYECTLNGDAGPTGSGTSFQVAVADKDDYVCTFTNQRNQVYPTLTTVPNPPTGTIGDVLNDTATLVDGNNPSGTILFKLYDPSNSTCTGDPVYSESVVVMGNGDYSTATGYSSNVVGTWRWVAEYSGDDLNYPVASGCDDELVTIGKDTPSIATEQTPTSGIIGDILNDSATVSGGYSPSGTVTFELYDPSDATCSGEPAFTETVALEAGSASTSVGYASDSVGTWRWVAIYNGDDNNNSVASGCDDEPVTIGKDTPSIATEQTPTSGIIGDILNDSATVSGGYSPSGTVTFELYDPSDATCSGEPAFTETVALEAGGASTSVGYASDSIGTWRWVAIYSGDDKNNTAASGCDDEPVTIGKDTPSIATVQNPASGLIGDILNDSATVSGGYSPSGTVTFELYDPSDATCSGEPAFTETVALEAGGASTSVGYTSDSVGTWRWVAIYNGDDNNNSVASGCDDEPVTISKYTSTITTQPVPASGLVGDILNDSATVTGSAEPTGQVTFNLYEPGDTICQSPVFTETVELVEGTASTTSGIGAGYAGTWRWTADYSGDDSNDPASSGCDDELVTISKYISTITTLPVPATGTVGDLLNDTATVTGSQSPTGEVTFELYEPGDATCESPVFTQTVSLEEDGSASTSGGYFAIPAGTYRWTADYSGDDANEPSNSGCDDELVVIDKVSPGITTTPDPAAGTVGVRLHDTATVTGGYSPTGTVTFELYDPSDATCSGEPAFTETVSLEMGGASTRMGYVSDSVGTWHWVAIYNGDDNNNPVASGCENEPVTIAPYRLYFPITTHDHVAPWCNLVAKQIAPSSYTVEAYVDWEWAAPVRALSESTSEDTPGIHRIKWGDSNHTTFTGEKGEATFYHTYGVSGWYEVVVMLWGTDGNKYFPCSQWVDPPPQLVVPVEN